MDRLLDPDRAVDSVDSAYERDHESVAEVLHLLATECLSHLAEQAEMYAPQPLGFVVAQLPEQLS